MIKSIRTKISIIVISFLFIGFLIGSITYYNILKNRALTELHNKSNTIAYQLSLASGYFLWNLDEDGIFDILEANLLDKNLYAILVFDITGDFFAGVYKDQEGRILKLKAPFFLKVKSSIVSNRDIIFKSKAGPEKLGLVVAYINPEPTLKSIRGFFFKNLLNFSLILFLSAFLLIIILNNIVIKRIQRIARVVGAVSNRDFNRSIPNLGNDEIGFLANQFNDMIEKLKEYEDELFYRIKRWEVTIRSIGDGVIITDKNGHITLMNDIACKLTGWEEKDALGKDLKEVFFILNEITRKPAESPVDKVLKYGHVVGLANHTVLISKDGREIPIKDSAAPIKDQNGNIMGVVLVFSDVSFEVNLLKQIEYSQMVHKGLMEVANVIVTITDKDGKVIFWNRAAEVITGYTKEEVLGKTIGWELLYPDSEYRKTMSNRVKKVIEQGIPIKGDESKITTKSNEKKVISWYSVPLMDKNRAYAYSLHVGVDVTDKKELERQKINKKTLEAITLFASGIAHDFNNIVTGIMGHIGVIKGLNSLEEIKKRITNVEKSLSYASNLISQLFSLSKRDKREKQEVNIEEVIVDLLELLQHKDKIQFKITIDDQLSPIVADKTQISQVIQNILVNAIQASEGISNYIELSAKNVEFFQRTKICDKIIDPGKYVEITIKDFGKGISEDVLPHIFEPLFTTNSKGHGLGLAICHSIIKEHEGEIVVESIPDKGTTFRIFLKAIPKEKEPAISSLEQQDLIPKKVLLVEDDDMIGEVTKELLNAMGILDVHIVKQGKEAIREYKKAMEMGDKFQVILCDLSLKGELDGRQTFEEILKLDPNAKGILTSGDPTDKTLIHYRKFGFKEKLKKPYTFEQLKKVILKTIKD